MTREKTYGLGLIGCGGFGRFCLENFSTMTQVRPAAVADTVKDAAEVVGKEFNISATTDPAQLITREDVDLVHIATPPSTHHELTMAALRAGKHVLCEKPLSITTAEADEIVTLAESQHKLAPVNFVLRYNAVTDAVAAVIRSGVLGRVLSARLTNCATDSKLGPDHWFWNRAISGGIFIEHGVHFFDLYKYWLGDGEVISATAEMRDSGDQQDRLTCLVRHADGTLASHYHGFDQIHSMDRTDHRLVCELGDIRVEGWIPLTMTVDAAVDDAGAAALIEACPAATLEMLEEYPDDIQTTNGRGKSRHVTQRIRLTYCPNSDKPAVYAASVRALLADQLAYADNPKHARRITERNGRDAVAMADTATQML